MLKIYLKYTEDDDTPDVGKETITHKVTKKDFENGFSETINISVKENGGIYRGKKAKFVTTFTFAVK